MLYNAEASLLIVRLMEKQGLYDAKSRVVLNSRTRMSLQDTTTTWSRVLPEKLTDPQLVKKFPAFYGIRRFITAFTRARHLFLS